MDCTFSIDSRIHHSGPAEYYTKGTEELGDENVIFFCCMACTYKFLEEGHSKEEFFSVGKIPVLTHPPRAL